jgi:lipoic acid synthetase/lipoate-protein ligase A
MVHIILPDNKDRRLSFYLAMEEFVARHLNVADAFFTWQVKPSVIFGRNQLIESEVNIKYCQQHGVEMYRRKSGGGCVYADKSNLMLSYITNGDSVDFTYHKYTTLVVTALRQLGIPATANGRNDILIDGKKVSGNAFYHLSAQHSATGTGRNIVHGTLLYDTDMQNMVGCITPDNEKLRSKGVQSVRQRITLLKDHTALMLDEIRDDLIDFVCREERMLTTEEIRQIEEMEQEYLSPAFIYGNNPRYTVVRKQRIDNVGTIEVRMEVKNGVIKDIDMKGDYFLAGDLADLCEALKGTTLNREALVKAIPHSVGDIIMNLKATDLITLILNDHGE